MTTEEVIATEIAERNTRWKDYVDPAAPGRRYFSIEHDCVSFTVVARDEEHAKEIFPGIYDQHSGGQRYQESVEECGEPIVTEIPGTTTIHDEGRDGLSHPINTYPVGSWASSEY